MKKVFFVSIAAAVMSIVPGPHSWAAQVGTIRNTKHNLSAGGPHAAGQTIYAQSEQEICVFCHIPHFAPSTGRPLWNHDMPSSGYTMYSSDYLTRAAYPMPSGLGTTNGSPGMLSRQCLSCHDGTVAVGAVYAVRGTVLGASLIAMAGVTASGMIPAGATNFGTDLSHHHPVGIQYNSSITIAFGSGSRTIELSTTPNTDPTQNLPTVYTEGGSQYVECSSCHDPHTQTQKFMRVGSGANLAANIATTCTGCHTKTGWSGSIHQSNTSAYSDTAVQTAFGANTVASLACMNCHTPHNAPAGTSYLNRQVEETTCFQGASGLTTETACHGSSSTGKKIQTVITRAYHHPTTTITGIHTDLDVLYPAGGPTGASSHGLEWTNNDQHAECPDCHTPHMASQGNHATPADSTGWYPATPSSTSNAVSNALKGASGVDISGAQSLWTVPTNFTTINSAAKEYQICFKCHSYYGLRAPSGVSSTLTQEGTNFTDQGLEFSQGNRAVHPVAMSLNTQPGEATYTGATPAQLSTGEMVAPWNTNVGTQTMYCSDCHGTDAENTGDPRGPHGSSYKFMLKGPGKYWPTDPTGKLYTSSGSCLSGSGCTTGNTIAPDGNLFCSNCHNVGSTAATPHGKTASKDAPCISCHPLIPHGWKRSRFVVYAGEATTYPAYVSNSVTQYLSGFQKVGNGAGYVQADCYSTNSSCSTAHGKVPTYSEP